MKVYELMNELKEMPAGAESEILPRGGIERAPGL